MSSSKWKAIHEADSKKDIEKLGEIFNSITAEDLNEPTSKAAGSTVIMCLLSLFDENNNYPYFLKNLFNSPNLDHNKLDIDRKNGINGYTPIMYAALRGHIEITQKLLTWGANPKIQTPHNMTALYLAFRFGQFEMFKLLLPLVNKDEIDCQRQFGQSIREEAKDKENNSSICKEWADLINQIEKGEQTSACLKANSTLIIGRIHY